MAAKILLIIFDQLRADCLTGELAKSINTPNLDALIDESVVFNRHYTVTVPCGPARASLLTGLYAMNHRSTQNGTPLSRVHPTVATEMRKSGYDPLLFGYTDTAVDPHNLHPDDPALRETEGVAAGFSEIVRMRFCDSSSWLGYLKSRDYDVPDNYWDIYNSKAPDGSIPGKITDPAIYSAADSDTAFLTDQTLREMSVRSNQDWFSTVTYIRPHPPLVAPAPYNTMYDPAAIPPPSRAKNVDSVRNSHPFFKAYFEQPTFSDLYGGFDGKMDKMSARTADELRSVYFGLISELDHHVGRLLDHLRDTGQYDDTLIVVTSDHGEMLGDHYMWGKNTPYDASYHVPLIIRDPHRRETAGSRIDAFTESIDLAPTLLDWVGQKSPPGFNGKSLLPWLDGKTPSDWRSHVFAEMDMGDKHYGLRYQQEFGIPPEQCNMAILRDDAYKLVHFNGGVAPLLYDLAADPDEMNNIAGDPAHAHNLQMMTRKMLDHRMTHAHHALSRVRLSGQGLTAV